MGCRILTEKGYGRSVFYCSTTMSAFGPVMEDEAEAEAFLAWLGKDPRLMKNADLEEAYAEFRTERIEREEES